MELNCNRPILQTSTLDPKDFKAMQGKVDFSLFRWTNLQTQTTIPWTNDDEVRLLKACKEYGHRWAKLAQEIGDGRSDNYLKNHFYSTLRRMVRWVNKFIKDKKK